MIAKLSHIIADIFIRRRLITEEQRESYEYGFELSISSLSNIIIVLTLGLLSGKFWESVVFYAVFRFTRLFTGGFHARNRLFDKIIFAAALIVVLITDWILQEDGKMNPVYSFGAGKVNFIDEISLKEAEINGEKVYLFSFAYDEGNNMKADEVLSMIGKTADGYEVEHLLSRGTITYPDIAEPFTKAFYRKGWSKYDIGLEQDYGDITEEEYNGLYKEYTGREM